MELKSLIASNREVDIESQDPNLEGFVITLAYASKDDLKKIRNKCITTKFNRKTRQPEEEIDEERFTALYIEQVVKGWKGLKYKYLREMIPVDLSNIEDEEAELEFSLENAKVLLNNSPDIDAWISGCVTDISNFNKAA